MSNAEMLKFMIEKGKRAYVCADLIYEVKLENIMPDDTIMVEGREFKIFSVDVRQTGIYIVPSYKTGVKNTYWKVPIQPARKEKEDKTGRNK
jgi:hypothetical protein